MNYPLLDIFLTTMWFFLWVMWIMLLFRVFADLFRDRELGGWAKAGWCVLLIVLPFLGVLIYLVAHGHGMAERDIKRQLDTERDFDERVRSVSAEQATTDRAEQLRTLAELKNQGEITDDEYQRAKDGVLAG